MIEMLSGLRKFLALTRPPSGRIKATLALTATRAELEMVGERNGKPAFAPSDGARSLFSTVRSLAAAAKGEFLMDESREDALGLRLFLPIVAD